MTGPHEITEVVYGRINASVSPPKSIMTTISAIGKMMTIGTRA